MIQLKPGIPPASLNKPTHSAARRKNRIERKKNGGLRFKRVFSDANRAIRSARMGTTHRGITDDGGKVIFKQEAVEVPKIRGGVRHQSRRLEVFLRGHCQRHRSIRRRKRNVGAPAHPSGHPHDHRLGRRGWLFRRRGCCGTVLRRADLAVLVNQYGAFNSPVWFNVGLYHQYGVGKDSARAIGITIARRATPSAPHPIRVSAGQRLLHPDRRGQHGDHHASRLQRGDALRGTAPAPART